MVSLASWVECVIVFRSEDLEIQGEACYYLQWSTTASPCLALPFWSLHSGEMLKWHHRPLLLINTPPFPVTSLNTGDFQTNACPPSYPLSLQNVGARANSGDLLQQK